MKKLLFIVLSIIWAPFELIHIMFTYNNSVSKIGQYLAEETSQN